MINVGMVHLALINRYKSLQAHLDPQGLSLTRASRFLSSGWLPPLLCCVILLSAGCHEDGVFLQPLDGNDGGNKTSDASNALPDIVNALQGNWHTACHTGPRFEPLKDLVTIEGFTWIVEQTHYLKDGCLQPIITKTIRYTIAVGERDNKGRYPIDLIVNNASASALNEKGAKVLNITEFAGLSDWDEHVGQSRSFLDKPFSGVDVPEGQTWKLSANDTLFAIIKAGDNTLTRSELVRKSARRPTSTEDGKTYRR